MTIEIENLELEELRMYTGCSEPQLVHYNEPNYGLFIAESPKVIHRALDAGYKPVSMLLETSTIEGESASLIERLPDIPTYVGKMDLLKNITGFTLTRGALCAMRRRAYPSVEELCKQSRRVVVLERVMNPANIGSIFRSAAALNMDGVLLSPGCADPLYRRAARVSMGTVFQIPWTYLPGKPEEGARPGLSILADMGYKSVAMALKEDSLSIGDPIFAQQEKLAIVMGTEGDGLDLETIDICDYTVMIPMSHGVDSLNVAAASSVAFWELGK